MYQLNETNGLPEYRRGLPEVPADVPRLYSAPRDEIGRSGARVRVVRVPGGFAFVEEKPASEGSEVVYQVNEIETWREHRSDLLREEGQLARRLRWARPKGWSGSAAILGFLAALMVVSLTLMARPARADIIQRILKVIFEVHGQVPTKAKTNTARFAFFRGGIRLPTRAALSSRGARATTAQLWYETLPQGRLINYDQPSSN